VIKKHLDVGKSIIVFWAKEHFHRDPILALQKEFIYHNPVSNCPPSYSMLLVAVWAFFNVFDHCVSGIILECFWWDLVAVGTDV
jgi:hypothetical protein